MKAFKIPQQDVSERISKPKINTSWIRLVMVFALSVALTGVSAYSSVSEVIAAGTITGDSISKSAGDSSPLATSSIDDLSIASVDSVMEWNAIMQTTVTAATPSPFFQARAGAIVQLAVFEAVNAILGDYEPYLGTITAAPGASPEAAAVAAAHRTLVTLFPASAVTLNSSRTRWRGLNRWRARQHC